MDLGLNGKRALVMGGSSGLGRGIAEELAAEGASVALCARNRERLDKTAAAIPGAVAFPCDLSKPGAATQLVNDVIARLGGLDILVTNTGGPPKGEFLDITDEQWQAGFQSLFLATVDAIRAALPGMKQHNWGRVLMVTSISVRQPLAALTVSNSIRPGLAGLANSISREVAKFGVTVNALLPGFTDTERLRELGTDLTKVTANIPAGRLGKPRELGALAAFLASDRAAYITGQAIACDGGFCQFI